MGDLSVPDRPAPKRAFSSSSAPIPTNRTAASHFLTRTPPPAQTRFRAQVRRAGQLTKSNPALVSRGHCGAGFQTCCIADFQIGSASETKDVFDSAASCRLEALACFGSGSAGLRTDAPCHAEVVLNLVRLGQAIPVSQSGGTSWKRPSSILDYRLLFVPLRRLFVSMGNLQHGFFTERFSQKLQANGEFR